MFFDRHDCTINVITGNNKLRFKLCFGWSMNEMPCHMYHKSFNSEGRKLFINFHRNLFESEIIIEKKSFWDEYSAAGCFWQSGHIATWTIYILRDTFAKLAIDSTLIDWDIEHDIVFRMLRAIPRGSRVNGFFIASTENSMSAPQRLWPLLWSIFLLYIYGNKTSHPVWNKLPRDMNVIY